MASDAHSEASDAPRTASGADLSKSQRIGAGGMVLAAAVLAGIGLYLSFEHVAVFAFERLRFQTLAKAQLFTVGVDVGIMILIALDLFMEWVNRPIGWLRFPAWLLTGATIVLNATSAAPAGAWHAIDYVAVSMHGVVPIMFIVIVEAGRSAIERIVRPAIRASAGIPLSRWFLDARTFFLWRRMKLWNVPTYDEAVKREQAMTVYRVLLKQDHGSIRKAPDSARLPITLARFGLTIEEALDAPRQAEEQGKALEAAREAAEAADRRRKADQATEDEIAALKRQGAVQAARHEVAALTGQAEVRANAELVAAERSATAETEAIQSAEAAEAEERRVMAAARASDARKRAADADEAAADAEERAADARRRTADAELAEEKARAEAETTRAAREEAAARAADAERRAADARRHAAEIELAAVEAEDVAALSQRDRNIRKVARLILTAGGDKEAVPVLDIQNRFSVAQATASGYRDEAAALIKGGYRPAGL